VDELVDDSEGSTAVPSIDRSFFVSRKIGYLATHYPSVSHSFILREILALEAVGVDIEPMAINPAPEDDVLTDVDRAERSRTFYVKSQSKAAVLRSVMRAFRRSPRGFLATAVHAVRSARFDLKAGLWRLLQLVEAAIVWDHCRETGVRHVHAHFGQVPATVAWFTAELGNRLDPDDDPWTWSVTVHGWHEFVNEREASLRQKVHAAAFVVCISDYTRSQLMRIAHPDHWKKLRVIRCGIDTAAFAQREPRPVGKPPRVLMVARLSPEKGHLVLLEALKLLGDRGMRVEAELIGPGEFRDGLERAVSSLGIADRVSFLGACTPDEINQHLRSADVFCLPSFAEGLPVALMEAMAVGVPVVTTYISGIPELVIDGWTGMVVPAGRGDLLASAIERLCDDRDLTSSIVSAARAKVEEQHELAHNIPALAALLTGTGELSGPLDAPRRTVR
jgi:colanic acid/amylovoran biosynthesis glycosyltransferase